MENVRFTDDVNICILQYIPSKKEVLTYHFSQYDDVLVYTPKMEYYRRDIKGIAVKEMFPGYLFVQTHRDAEDFEVMLQEITKRTDGIVRELEYEGTASLTENERLLFSQLLDEEAVMRMSYAVLKNGKAHVTDGPLKKFEKNIIKVDKHNQLAYLDISLINRDITAGLRFI